MLLGKPNLLCQCVRANRNALQCERSAVQVWSEKILVAPIDANFIRLEGSSERFCGLRFLPFRHPGRIGANVLVVPRHCSSDRCARAFRPRQLTFVREAVTKAR